MITVVGSINLDLIATMSRLPKPGETVPGKAFVTAPGGKLLIVDFAPHEHEFLREEHAHKRLGFSGAQMTQWLSDAGLTPGSAREFAPPPGDRAGLTVSLWVASRPAANTAAMAAAFFAQAASRAA